MGRSLEVGGGLGARSPREGGCWEEAAGMKCLWGGVGGGPTRKAAELPSRKRCIGGKSRGSSPDACDTGFTVRSPRQAEVGGSGVWTLQVLHIRDILTSEHLRRTFCLDCHTEIAESSFLPPDPWDVGV